MMRQENKGDEVKTMVELSWENMFESIKESWRDYGYIMTDLNYDVFFNIDDIEYLELDQNDRYKVYVCAQYFTYNLLTQSISLPKERLNKIWTNLKCFFEVDSIEFKSIEEGFKLLRRDIIWSDELLYALEITKLSNQIAYENQSALEKLDWNS